MHNFLLPLAAALGLLGATGCMQTTQTADVPVVQPTTSVVKKAEPTSQATVVRAMARTTNPAVPTTPAWVYYQTPVDDKVGTRKVLAVHEGGIKATHGGTKFAGYVLMLMDDGSGIWIRERYGAGGAAFNLASSTKQTDGTLMFRMPNNEPLTVNPDNGNLTWKIQGTDLESHDVKITRHELSQTAASKP